MYSEEYIKQQIALTFLPRLNSFSFLPVLTECGGIEPFFKEKDAAFKTLLKPTKFKSDSINRKEALQKAEKELTLIERFNVSICSFEEENYPTLLKECEDAPLIFYYKGKLTTENYNYLGIVGTRKASDRSCERVNILIQELKESGNPFIIVSGLAFGIDGAAHKAALRHGVKTYAVLGHGLHMIYPAAHKNLSDRILDEGGALISEYPCSIAVTPSNFLQRNRIIAGLSQAILVAESAAKGGAMSTARIAQSYNRDVLAIPGRPEDKMSAGCNILIKKNYAALTETSKDILEIMGLSCSTSPTNLLLDIFDRDDNESVIIQLLHEKGGMHIDELSHLAKIPVPILTVLLLQLELEGKVIALPGKNYTIK